MFSSFIILISHKSLVTNRIVGVRKLGLLCAGYITLSSQFSTRLRIVNLISNQKNSEPHYHNPEIRLIPNKNFIFLLNFSILNLKIQNSTLENKVVTNNELNERKQFVTSQLFGSLQSVKENLILPSVNKTQPGHAVYTWHTNICYSNRRLFICGMYFSPKAFM